MRHVFSAAAIMMIGFGTEFLAPPALAYDGCLGAKVTACLAAIKPYLQDIDYQLSLQSIDKFQAGDIAGKRKAKQTIAVTYHSKYLKQFETAPTVLFQFPQSLEISQIEVTLRNGVSRAETEADYQATRMYETVIFALGSHDNCRELATPHDFYLFFHKDVKTRLKNRKVERAVGAYKPASEFVAETGWIGICGKKLNYVVSGAEWGAAQADMERKYHDYIASLVFR